MNPTVSDVAVALLWAAAAAAATWLVTYPVRRRSLSGVLASVVLTGTAASVGSVVGGIHVMLLPMHHEGTIVGVAVASGLLAAVGASAAARRLTRDNAVLREAVADVARGIVPDGGGRPLTAELEHVRRELRETATQLAETRRREQALESARRELVSWVSHDLRTPLAGLRAMAEALEDGVAANPEQYYKRIHAEVERLGGMVDDLFDLSRLQAGAFSRDVEDIPLDDLVSDCLASLEPLAAAQGVHLTGSVSGAASVLGNGPELNRALTNLVANAIRHTRADGQVEVQVGITVREHDAGPRALAEVVVRDECGGIPEGELHRVFDVGFRGEPARTPHAVNPAGAGLGLAITRGIVEAHDGTVDVENAPGGCRFRLRLPVAG